MERNENDNSSSLNWRTSKRAETSQDQDIFKNFSSCRSNPNTNSRRNNGSTGYVYKRDSAYQIRQRPNFESNSKQREGKKSDSRNEDCTYEGNWAFRVEDEEIENFKEILQKLHEDNPSLFVQPPYSERYKKKGLRVISCKTADYRDVTSVRNVVKIILNVVDHPYGIHYYHKGCSKYFFLKNLLFRIVKRENGTGCVLIEDETTVSITDKVRDISLDEKDDDSSTDLPSNITDRKCLFYPSESAVENLPSQAGKWMLYGSKDLPKMDRYWKKLKLLCDRGVLAALKSSTAADERGGVIRAYTGDSSNMEEVSKAGTAIIEETGCNEILYYKTNDASKKGMYTHEGKRNVSAYCHAGDSKFCVRDEYHRWKLWQAM